MRKKEKYALILAGGEGRRAGGEIPKQFREICGRPLVWWSMKSFHDTDPETHIILVCHPGFFDDWDILFSQLPEEDKIEHELCCGGRTRAESVKNGLMCVPDGAYVAVHDGARPLIDRSLIERGWKTLYDNEVTGVFPAIPVTDSIRIKKDGGTFPVDRSEYMAVQTPQIFFSTRLKECYNTDVDHVFTDDVSLVQSLGLKVCPYEGDTRNIKVTNPEDFVIAEAMLKQILQRK